MCKYSKECLFVGDGCNDQITKDECDEFARKEKLYEELCPIMIQLKYKPESSQCNILYVKSLIPLNIECHEGKKCICEIVPELQPLIQNCINDNKDNKSITPHLRQIERILHLFAQRKLERVG